MLAALLASIVVVYWLSHVGALALAGLATGVEHRKSAKVVVIVGQQMPLCHGGYGHMADGLGGGGNHEMLE